MHQSIDLLHKMRPKNLEDSVHNKMIEDVVHEEIETGKIHAKLTNDVL